MECSGYKSVKQYEASKYQLLEVVMRDFHLLEVVMPSDMPDFCCHIGPLIRIRLQV
jgi:hypothetical protein